MSESPPDASQTFEPTTRHRWRRRTINEQEVAWFPMGGSGEPLVLEQAYICRETGEVRWEPIEVAQ